jgi:hypothetical protein
VPAGIAVLVLASLLVPARAGADVVDYLRAPE